MTKNISEDKSHLVDLNEANLAIKENRFEDALKILKIILDKYPQHIDCLYMASASSRYLKKYKDAKNYIDKLLTVAPDMGRAYQELAHLQRDMGNEEISIKYYRQACELNPALLSSWKSLHNFFVRTNNHSAANTTLLKINKLESQPSILLYIEQILHEGRIAIAEKKCRAFLKKNPTHTYGMYLLSEIANRFGHFDEAEFLLSKAVEFDPDDGDLRMKYAEVLRKKQKFSETLEQVEILCKKFPENLAYEAQLATEIMQNGDHEGAISIFNRLLLKNPNNFSIHTSKGHALKTLGMTEKAIESYQSSYKIKPDHGESYFSLSNLKTYSFTKDEISNMKTQLKRLDLPLKEQAYFNFALASAYESAKNYDQAFLHLDKGNQIKKSQSKYKIDQMDSELQLQHSICDIDFFKNLGDGGCKSSDPIFILGLPRAGSTLIEQILASHSMIDGTLELPNILSLAQSLRGDDVYGKYEKYPSCMKEFTNEKRIELGEAYINDTKIHRKNAPYFTDKMPNNFRHIGLIHLILPNAKIIDARRYPLDCCFSMFKQLFAQGQEFTYGLKEAGSYYNSYVKLMNHWDKVLPGKILKVNNEDVIEDLEGQVKRLLRFIDVPYEENCITFHETERLVRTASSEQVRQPINKKGIGRWKPYAKYLKPLIETLDNDLLKQKDIDLINS